MRTRFLLNSSKIYARLMKIQTKKKLNFYLGYFVSVRKIKHRLSPICAGVTHELRSEKLILRSRQRVSVSLTRNIDSIDRRARALAPFQRSQPEPAEVEGPRRVVLALASLLRLELVDLGISMYRRPTLSRHQLQKARSRLSADANPIASFPSLLF